MELHAIPFATITTALDAAHATFAEPTGFNTCFRPRAAVACLVPHVEHRRPPTEPFDYSIWQPLIIASQGLGVGYRFALGAAATQRIVKAGRVCAHRARVPEGLVEDVIEVWPRYAEVVRPPWGGGDGGDGGRVPTDMVFKEDREWFLRVDSCITKDAPQRGPVHSLRDVVARLCSSARAGSALARALERDLDNDDETLTVFLVPFNERMDPSYEYRCFCPPGGIGISAISQYRWTQRWAEVSRKEPETKDREQSDGVKWEKSSGHGKALSTATTLNSSTSSDRARDVATGTGAVVTFDDYQRARRILRGAEDIYQQIFSFATKHDAERKTLGKGKDRSSGHSSSQTVKVTLPKGGEAFINGWIETEKPTPSMSSILRRDGFTFDVLETFDGDGSQGVQLVELNEFGAMSGCGSCLFEWIRDAEALYGVHKAGYGSGGCGMAAAPVMVEFRVVK